MEAHIGEYVDRLTAALKFEAMRTVPVLAEALRDAWRSGRTIYFCGNGGSAGNAVHLANDFLYGVGTQAGGGMRVEALPANVAVLTCLANDVGYADVFSEQLKVKANAGDVLVALSGSGNSPNIVRALETGNALRMRTFAILAFSGGSCKAVAQHPLHFPVDDMQIAEDLQLVVGHMCMQWLARVGRAAAAGVAVQR